MTVTTKTAEALESELVAAFEAIIAKLPVTDSQNRAAFYGEGCEGYKKGDFAKAAAKLLNKAERNTRSNRKRLLFQLANLHDASKLPSSFMKAIQPFAFDTIPPAAALQRSQWTLQYVWRRELSADKKQVVVQLLFAAATAYPKYGGLVPSLLSQNLEFNQKNFLGQLVLGVLENWPTMAMCANPECPVPYFFAKRVTQKYCERGECTRYALRKKALKHWRKKYGNANAGRET